MNNLERNYVGSRQTARCETQSRFETAEVLSPLHRHCQLDLALAGEQRNPANLAQVHPDWVVEASAPQIMGLSRTPRFHGHGALLVIASKLVGCRRAIQTETVVAE